MKALTTILSRFVPINIENIDTDQIIPARFLKATTKDGFGIYSVTGGTRTMMNPKRLRISH
jgi:3-isopropylmalate dehydratase small subunit